MPNDCELNLVINQGERIIEKIHIQIKYFLRNIESQSATIFPNYWLCVHTIKYTMVIVNENECLASSGD